MAPAEPQAAPVPVALRRSWLFLPGADRQTLLAAADCGADVLCQELEDFTPPERRPEARRLNAEVMAHWTAAGRVAAVRVNPLWDCGVEDLEAVLPGAPHAVLLPKVSEPAHVTALEREIARLEARLGLPAGRTEIVPNIELARGLMQTYAIATASPRVVACLVASEDMAADLGAERGRDGAELRYVRERFHLECVAAGVLSIDCPYTFRDEAGLVADTRFARRLGYAAKSAVAPAHAAVINRELTPQPEAIAEAQRVVAAFERARADGAHGVEVAGNLVEMPTYNMARRLLARARAFGLA